MGAGRRFLYCYYGCMGTSPSWWGCRDALLRDGKRLRIDVSDIKNFDGDLGSLLETDPTEYLPLVCPCLCPSGSQRGAYNCLRAAVYSSLTSCQEKISLS